MDQNTYFWACLSAVTLRPPIIWPLLIGLGYHTNPSPDKDKSIDRPLEWEGVEVCRPHIGLNFIIKGFSQLCDIVMFIQDIIEKGIDVPGGELLNATVLL